eukprot:TRINITY_DN45715_c0_g1_i1.p2 TRINITY_DN45715_c0_g1~~TRINITY_DN45715_c0_g1_i1.p2  ORF type:complete len:151 (-),score=14.90 TRINITY_DN45715_c0_g1_i1:296-748(-)
MKPAMPLIRSRAPVRFAFTRGSMRTLGLRQAAPLVTYRSSAASRALIRQSPVTLAHGGQVSPSRGAFELEALAVYLLVGALSGYLAGVLVTGYGFGVAGNVVIGIIGATIAGTFAPRFGLFAGPGIVSSVASATLGATLFLMLLGLFTRR